MFGTTRAQIVTIDTIIKALVDIRTAGSANSAVENAVNAAAAPACATKSAPNAPTTPPRAGYFCPPSTTYPKEYPCPNGTFSDQLELKSVDACTPCSAGQYCARGAGGGLTAPNGPCAAGYFCGLGSSTKTPGDGEVVNYAGETCAAQSADEVNGVCPWG